MRFAQRRCHTRGRERANVREQERLAPDPVPKKPASHAHVDEPATLVLLAGQAVQLEARTLLNVPAGHAVTYPGIWRARSAQKDAHACACQNREAYRHTRHHRRCRCRPHTLSSGRRGVACAYHISFDRAAMAWVWSIEVRRVPVQTSEAADPVLA